MEGWRVGELEVLRTPANSPTLQLSTLKLSSQRSLSSLRHGYLFFSLFLAAVLLDFCLSPMLASEDSYFALGGDGPPPLALTLFGCFHASDRLAELLGASGVFPRLGSEGCCRGFGCGRGLSSIALAIPCIGTGSFFNKILKKNRLW